MQMAIDMDGVLVDWLGGVSKLYNLNFNPYPFLGEWDCINKLGLNTEEFWKPLSRDFYANLDWTVDGEEILKYCVDAVGWDNICVLTSCIKDGRCAAGKIDWIQRKVPKLRRNYLIGPKKYFASNSNRVLIDDANHNIDSWIGPSILVPRDWNRHYAASKYSAIIVREKIKDLLNDSESSKLLLTKSG